MKFVYHKSVRYLVRDKLCLGMPCLNIKRFLTTGKRHALVGYKVQYDNRYVKMCKTLYDNGWTCPEETFSMEVFNESIKRGYKIVDF